MISIQPRAFAHDRVNATNRARACCLLASLILLGVGNVAVAQDVGRAGSLTPLPGQTVDIAVSDGSGIRFRGSVGTWKNFYLMFDYGSTDIDLSGRVTNANTGFVQEFEDQFDYTTIRGGIGFTFSVFDATDIYGELTYDSLDFDFGSFAGEDFDMDRKGTGVPFEEFAGFH